MQRNNHDTYYGIFQNRFQSELFNYFLDFYYIFSRENGIILIGIHSEQFHNTYPYFVIFLL